MYMYVCVCTSDTVHQIKASFVWQDSLHITLS